MIVSDFIKSSTTDLQEKSTDKKFWDDPQLLIKFKRAYTLIQGDVPYFIATETLSIKEGIKQYHLKKPAVDELAFEIGGFSYVFCERENLHLYKKERFYTFQKEEVTLSKAPSIDTIAEITYKYLKHIKTEQCDIELPSSYEEPLRLLFLSFVHEKSTRNAKERDLSVHYLKRYENKVAVLKSSKKVNWGRTTYQKV